MIGKSQDESSSKRYIKSTERSQTTIKRKDSEQEHSLIQSESWRKIII